MLSHCKVRPRMIVVVVNAHWVGYTQIHAAYINDLWACIMRGSRMLRRRGCQYHHPITTHTHNTRYPITRNLSLTMILQAVTKPFQNQQS